MKRKKAAPHSSGMTTRRFMSRGVDVQIHEGKDHVELSLDGIPVHVSVIDGEFYSDLANQFKAFGSIDEVVNTLLSNEGRTWTLHGRVSGEQHPPHHHHPLPGGHTHAVAQTGKQRRPRTAKKGGRR